jgi:hypothetical protein
MLREKGKVGGMWKMVPPTPAVQEDLMVVRVVRDTA